MSGTSTRCSQTRSATSTRVYASTVHCRPDSEAWNPRPIEGRATFTMVTSSPTMRRLIEQISRMPMRRRRLSSPITVGPPLICSELIIIILS